MAPRKRIDYLYLQASELEDRGRINEAVKRYEIVARFGDPGAQTNLANLLDDYVSPPRPDDAVYWYERAVRAGYSPAAWNLAMHYRNLKQPYQYRRWLRIAAAMGDEDAIEKVQELKAHFRTVPQTHGDV